MCSFVLVDGCDFERYPVGGQLSFCKQLIECYGEDIFLVGVSSNAEPVGVWYKKKIQNKQYWCFNLYRSPSRPKPLVPLRLKTLFALLYHRNKILKNVLDVPFFINAPESMIALTFLRNVNEKYWYIFHGVENPLAMPRYLWGKLFAQLFESLLFKSLRHASRILACADKKAIAVLLGRAKKTPFTTDVIQFPTRYDDKCFYPDYTNVQLAGANHKDLKKIVVTGRINEVKGWPFLLDVFAQYISKYDKSNTTLVFVGDGEDRSALEAKAQILGISKHVKVTGFVSKEEVRAHLCDCNLVVVGSFKEGWSISMLEALACGKSIVTTDVSGASDMIESGVNGFICMERNPELFAKMVNRALSQFPFINEFSLDVASNYRVSNLKHSLDTVLNLNVNQQQ